MRIRSILPDFWRSEDVAALDWETRLLFIGLWSYCDDNGVGRDSEAIIAGDLFALDMAQDAPETLRRVSEGLRALHEGGQIDRYEVDGKRFLYCRAWDRCQRVQKPGKPRYPRPTRGNGDSPDTLPTPSGDSPETLPTVSVPEKGRRGEGEKGRSNNSPAADAADSAPVLALVHPPTPTGPEPDPFDEWWAAWPALREGKATALKAWPKAVKAAGGADVILTATRLLAARMTRERIEPRYVKRPTSWLNQQAWADETETRPTTTTGPGAVGLDDKWDGVTNFFATGS